MKMHSGGLRSVLFRPDCLFPEDHCDEQASEDIVVNVFIRLWQNRKTLGNINNLSAYLYTAIKYALRSITLKPARTSATWLSRTRTTAALFLCHPESSMIGKEEIRTIEKAINQLPPF